MPAGTPAMTSRGCLESDFETIVDFLHTAAQIAISVQREHGKLPKAYLKGLQNNNEVVELRNRVESFSAQFAMPGFEPWIVVAIAFLNGWPFTVPKKSYLLLLMPFIVTLFEASPTAVAVFKIVAVYPFARILLIILCFGRPLQTPGEHLVLQSFSSIRWKVYNGLRRHVQFLVSFSGSNYWRKWLLRRNN